MVVGADVEDDRQTALRRHSRARRVECEFPDRNAHAPGTEIAEPENALTVGHDDEPHILLRPVPENFAEPASHRYRQVHAARGAEDVGEFLAGFAHRRRIDERHICRRVRHQNRIEQGLVAGLQIGQDEILLKIVLQARDLGMPPRDLPIDRGDGRRQQAFEAVSTPLGFRESSPLVQAGIVEQVVTMGVFVGRVGHWALPWVTMWDENTEATRAPPSFAWCSRSPSPD